MGGNSRIRTYDIHRVNLIQMHYNPLLALRSVA